MISCFLKVTLDWSLCIGLMIQLDRLVLVLQEGDLEGVGGRLRGFGDHLAVKVEVVILVHMDCYYY
jgi:hypothetical protein